MKSRVASTGLNLRKGVLSMRIIDLLNNEVTERELLSYYNASVTYEKLPDGISGFVYSYKGIQNIFINRGLSYYKRKKTLLHELAHIELNQLNQYDGLLAFKREKYEDEADRYIKLLLESTRIAEGGFL